MSYSKINKNHENTRLLCEHHAEEKRQQWYEENKEKPIEFGTYYKVGIAGKSPMGDPTKEWMWVLAMRETDDGVYVGVLSNEPVVIKNVRCGEDIIFDKKMISETFNQ